MHWRNLHYLRCKVKTAENNPVHIVKNKNLSGESFSHIFNSPDILFDYIKITLNHQRK